MLVEFQQAFADLVGSPALCHRVLQDPSLLRERYDLTAREASRLERMVASRGMSANCILYRANRLAPLVLNAPDVCEVLGPVLPQVTSAYWTAHPTTNVHFLREAEAFLDFVRAAGTDGSPLLDGICPATLDRALEHEGERLRSRLDDGM